MKNIIEIEHTLLTIRYVLSQVLIRNIEVAMLTKDTSKKTLKMLICTVLYDCIIMYQKKHAEARQSFISRLCDLELLLSLSDSWFPLV